MLGVEDGAALSDGGGSTGDALVLPLTVQVGILWLMSHYQSLPGPQGVMIKTEEL